MENRYLLFLHLCLEHVFCYSIQWHHYKDLKGELHGSAIKKHGIYCSSDLLLYGV